MTIKQLFLLFCIMGAAPCAFAQEAAPAPLAPDTQNTSLLQQNLQPSDLRIYGDKTAPKTIYLFSSLSCPHCGVFHNEVFPDLIERFVKTKQAKLVIVDMPYDTKAITGTLYSRCVSPKNYDAFIDRMYENIANLTYAENPRAMMEGFALELGENENALDVCVGNDLLRRKIMDQRNNLSNLYLVRAMPTLVVVNSKSPLRVEGTDKSVILRDIQNKLEEK